MKETIHISSSPMLELELNNGNPVYYDKVTVYTESNDQHKNLIMVKLNITIHVKE